MKQKHISKIKSLIILLTFVFAASLLLTGCSGKNKPKTPESSNTPQTSSQDSTFSGTENPSSEASNTPDSSSVENAPSGTASLDAVVMQLLEDGVKARPTITTDVEDGQVAEQRLGEDDGTDITVIFTSDTVFQIEEIDRTTYNSKYKDATKDAVKKDSSIYVWGTYSGTELLADRVVVLRFI